MPQFSQTYSFPVQIYYEDTDFSGVVYHANFLKYFERAREHMIGTDTLKQLWHQHHLGFAVYRCDMVCHEGIEFADTIDVRTRFYMESKYRTLWQQEIWRPQSNKAAITATIEMVCLNQARQLTPMPNHLITAINRHHLHE